MAAATTLETYYGIFVRICREFPICEHFRKFSKRRKKRIQKRGLFELDEKEIERDRERERESIEAGVA